jgi:predicted phosphoribosyltransferase
MTNEQQQRHSDLLASVDTVLRITKHAVSIVDSGDVTGVTTAKARIAIRNACDNLVVAAEELRKAQGVSK